MKTIFIILAFASLFICPFLGMTDVNLSNISADPSKANIFWNLRVPRVALAFVAGSALGLAGMTFQALFRNALATPYTLGVASGASFGAVLAIRLGLFGSLLGLPILNVFGLLGAVVATLLIYLISVSQNRFSTSTMLLSGVAISLFFSSLMLFIQYASDFSQSFQVVRWLMGGLDVVGFQPVMQIVPFALFGSLVIILLSSRLDLISIGEELAQTKGLNTKSLKLTLFFATSLMVGGVVSFTGPIGFVGLIAPHICRLLFGSLHRSLAPLTFLASGTFLVICDTFARTIIAPAEIPVGVITALLGGPFFLWILISKTSSKKFQIND